MIKEYCIIYEEEQREKVYASNPSFQYIETTVHELNIPALTLFDAVDYAHNTLELEGIKEVFEL